ncbi:MAG: Patatin [Frankiales bacterium]|nr:Patatin [Frankiales bacterium]
MTRTGLVLGAGGLTGQAFHLGVLTALADAGFDGRSAQVLVGTSAGSLVAAGLALGLSAADLRAQVLGEPLSPEGARLRAARKASSTAHLPGAPAGPGPLAPRALLQTGRRGVRPGSLAAGLLPAGTQSTEGISRPLRQVFGDTWPDRDLRICAVRARDARRVVFGTPDAPPVDVGTAVAASCAIPAYFAPVSVGADRYVDGGMHSPSNADVVLGDGLDLVLVLSPMTMARGAGRPADLPVRIAVGRYLAAEVRRLRRTGARVVVVQPTARDLQVMGSNPMRGDRARDVLETVAASVRARLARQGRLAEAVAAG